MAAAVICSLGVGVKIAEVYREYQLLPEISADVAAKKGVVKEVTGFAAWAAGPTEWASSANAAWRRSVLTDTQTAPETYYGLGAYAIRSLFADYVRDPHMASQRVLLRPQGADVAAATAQCSQPCALSTNLVTSPYFAMRLNGTPASPDLFRDQNGKVVLLLPAGGYQIDVRLGTWSTKLYGYSTAALAVVFWLAGLGIIFRFRGEVWRARPGKLADPPKERPS